MKDSYGKRLFIFCFWMMAILMMPFALAGMITIMYAVLP